MKIVLFITLLSSMLITGCISRPTTENYDKYLDTLLGKTESELLNSWGVPNKSYTAGDTTIISYDEFGPTIFIGQVAVPITCTTTFTLKNRTVSDWKWKGNGCKI